MAQEALGVIETKGLVGLIEATDVMLKTADVELVGYKELGSGVISVTVRGDVAAVQAAVAAGTGPAKELSMEFIGSHVIPRPDADTEKILPQSVSTPAAPASDSEAE